MVYGASSFFKGANQDENPITECDSEMPGRHQVGLAISACIVDGRYSV
jgi:hypothetical protein